MKESPLFVKTYELLLWIIKHVEKFPRSQRFILARRLQDAAFDLYEELVAAARVRRRPINNLKRADDRLDMVRRYFRISRDLGFCSLDQYEFVTTGLNEIGKMIGAWMTRASSGGTA